MMEKRKLKEEAVIRQIKAYLRAKTSRWFNEIRDKDGNVIRYTGDIVRGGRKVATVKVTFDPPKVTARVFVSEESMPKNIDIQSIVNDIKKGVQRYLSKFLHKAA